MKNRSRFGEYCFSERDFLKANIVSSSYCEISGLTTMADAFG